MVQINQSSGVNLAEGPEGLHKLFAQALNSGDLDALVALYALDRFLMARSVSAQGKAVLSANWRFHGTTTDGGDVSSPGTSIEVARREPDGSWRYLIDLPYGLG